MRKQEIILTADGSSSIYVPDLNETYHSVKGAIQESKHVFIQNGFHQLIADQINILEIGFGTGLNALLTHVESIKTGVKVRYSSIEKYPLSDEIINSLNYTETIELSEFKEIFKTIHEASWNIETKIGDYFYLNKIEIDINDYIPTESFNLVYFDAFAPSKQPEMWSETIFKKISMAMNPEGILTTYSATGRLKRMLRGLGYEVYTLEGPPGKKEMVMAKKRG